MKQQSTLFPEEHTSTMPPPEIELISFRELVPEISDTGYLTHAIFYYPAKFIPHVVRYAINTFTKEGDWIIDPFAGSGTVGLEAYLCKRNAVLLDLNPLLNHIIPLKIYLGKERLRKAQLCQILENMAQHTSQRYIPEWSNVNYWYPPEMLEVLSKYWGFIKDSEQTPYSRIVESALLKASKHFSYAEHRTPKLFRSKRKLSYIEELLKSNWEETLRKMVFSLSLKTLRDINDFVTATPKHQSQVECKGGVDSSDYQIARACDAIITSPPYLQAQEYIRTVKMDLFWLGYSEEEIRSLARLEIPYRKADRVIQTKTLDSIRTDLNRNDLIKLLDSYFCHTINALENSMNCLKSNATACIFVGNPLIDGIKVEIWRILMEYFTERGFVFEKIYEDRIKARQLFGARKNKNPEGMKSEFLLILRKA
jgi:DNA modification methylase